MSVDWAEVYRTSFRELVHFLNRHVWDVDRAQDMAQEVFLRAMDQEPQNPRAWLFRVALNLARDEARLVLRRKKHLALLRSEAEAAQTVPAEGTNEMERAERIEKVRRALEQLSQRDRDILQLWDAGLNYTEIAAETGLSPGSIGTTLARARQRLADAYTALEDWHVSHG